METSSEENKSWGRIPNLGPVRQKLLEAAGINSREEFARLTVEQVVSLTGMGRTQAELALKQVQGRTGTLPAVTESDDPLAPDAQAEPQTTGGVEDDAQTKRTGEAFADPAALPPGRLDSTVFRLRTAASDVTRLANDEQITKPLLRLIAVVDQTVPQSDTLRPKQRRYLADLFENLAQRLERAAQRMEREPLSPRRVERLRERIRAARRATAALIKPE
jgi:hypothetical protein